VGGGEDGKVLRVNDEVGRASEIGGELLDDRVRFVSRCNDQPAMRLNRKRKEEKDA
jgi:hypothetical protein